MADRVLPSGEYIVTAATLEEAGFLEILPHSFGLTEAGAEIARAHGLDPMATIDAVVLTVACRLVLDLGFDVTAATLHAAMPEAIAAQRETYPELLELHDQRTAGAAFAAAQDRLPL